jgi:hypothetical protein
VARFPISKLRSRRVDGRLLMATLAPADRPPAGRRRWCDPTTAASSARRRRGWVPPPEEPRAELARVALLDVAEAIELERLRLGRRGERSASTSTAATSISSSNSAPTPLMCPSTAECGRHGVRADPRSASPVGEVSRRRPTTPALARCRRRRRRRRCQTAASRPRSNLTSHESARHPNIDPPDRLKAADDGGVPPSPARRLSASARARVFRDAVRASRGT